MRKKHEILSKCEYRCDLCPAYSGNIHRDDDRQRASDAWFKYFGFRVKPEEINCDGCKDNTEPIDKKCPVHPCVVQKRLDNCGYCQDMPCDKLKTRMNFIEERPINLKDVPREDYIKYIQPYLSKERLIKIKAKRR